MGIEPANSKILSEAKALKQGYTETIPSRDELTKLWPKEKKPNPEQILKECKANGYNITPLIDKYGGENVVQALEKAAIKGNSEAYYVLGKIAINRPELAGKAISILEDAAIQGNSQACYVLGNIAINRPELAERAISALENVAIKGIDGACKIGRAHV